MGNVTLEDVTKIYDGEESIIAVDDIDLSVHDGEFLVLVGPSGCGKSTTLRMIAGLEEITEGTIEIGDVVVNDKKPQDRNIAMVFQNYALYPHMTVRENMSFGLRRSTDDDADTISRKVEETAQLLEIEELLNQQPKQLSGGQQQRVALGRSIIRDPEVFLMDEPLSNLDAKLRTQMRTELQRLQDELGVTTIYVTHDQTEAMTMGDRIAVMNHGEIQQVAPPEECYDNPNNLFVAGFIGSPSMNFFDVHVEETSGGVTVSSDGFTTSLEDVVLESNGYTLGIRPEDFMIVESDDPAVTAVVDVVEPMGADNFLYLKTEPGEIEFTARVDSDFRPEEGDTISLDFDPADIHFFNQSGDRVQHQRETATPA